MTFTSFYRVSIVTLVALVILSCQQESDPDTETSHVAFTPSKHQIVSLTANDVRSTFTELQRRNPNKQAQETFFGRVDSTKIRGIVYDYGHTAITMRIIPREEDKHTLYNMITVLDENDTVVDLYVRKYISDTHFSGRVVPPGFTGRIFSYETDGTLRGHVGFSGGTLNSLPPCYDCTPMEDQDDPSDDSSDTSGGGDGGSDTTDDPDGDPFNTGDGNNGDTTNDDPTDGDQGDGGDSTPDCNVVVYVYNCGGTNADTPHPSSDCAGTNGPNNGNLGTQSYDSITITNCWSDKTSEDPRDTIIPCCEDDVIVIEEEDDPCEDLKKLTITNAEVRVKLKQLITSNANKEKAFKIRKNPANNLDTPTDLFSSTNTNDCTEVNLINQGFMFAAAHSHPISCDSYGMFSGGDILQLAQMASQFNGTGADNFNTYTFMLTFNGKAFAIKFGDQEAMQSLVDIFNSPQLNLQFQDNFYRYRTLEQISGSHPSESSLTKKFLSILEDNDINIDFYKASVDSEDFVTGWTKRELDINGNLIDEAPCL